MKINLKKIIIITLIIAWMILVFYLSNQIRQDSSKLSGNITIKILKIFNVLNSKTPKEILSIKIMIRKLAHFLIYTLGGILVFLFVNLYKIKLKNKILITYIIGTVYAITDEVHQLFVLGRSGRIRDVFIDSLGVITGIIIALLLIKIVNKITKNIENKSKINSI